MGYWGIIVDEQRFILTQRKDLMKTCKLCNGIGVRRIIHAGRDSMEPCCDCHDVGFIPEPGDELIQEEAAKIYAFLPRELQKFQDGEWSHATNSDVIDGKKLKLRFRVKP